MLPVILSWRELEITTILIITFVSL
uniref:Uncharacterized protein n=1 Tax=Anguilla anguilla TaxID=7936 RepID=A0A0E9UIF4_ANGAN